MILRAGKYEQWNSVFTHNIESDYENYLFILLKKIYKKYWSSEPENTKWFYTFAFNFFLIKEFLQNVKQHKTNRKYKRTTKAGLSNRKI